MSRRVETWGLVVMLVCASFLTVDEVVTQHWVRGGLWAAYSAWWGRALLRRRQQRPAA